MSIYLIEMLWVDKWENSPSDAYGYSPYSYVNTESEAIKICKDCKMYNSSDCWAITNELPKYRYKKIDHHVLS